MQIRNHVDISLDLNSANVILMAMMKVAESKFYGFPLRDILDYNCWLAMIPAPDLDRYGVRVSGEEATMALEKLAATVASLNLNVNCILRALYEFFNFYNISDFKKFRRKF